jgi:hypothetical protein
MGFFSEDSKKNSGAPRRSSGQRNESLLGKLAEELKVLEKLDKKISAIDVQLGELSKEKFNRARKELLGAKRLNWVGQRDESLVKVEGYKATIAETNQKNLAIIQSKYGKK